METNLRWERKSQRTAKCKWCNERRFYWYTALRGAGLRAWQLRERDGWTVHVCPRSPFKSRDGTPQPGPAPEPMPESAPEPFFRSDPPKPQPAEMQSAAEARDAQARGAIVELTRSVSRLTEDMAHFGRGLDAKIAEIVKRTIPEHAVTRVEVALPNGETKDAGVQHRTFPRLVELLACRLHVWIVGPAGSGKTSAGFHAATALGLSFVAESMGPRKSEADIFGYVSPLDGKFYPGLVYEAYKSGGIVMIDECDNTNPSVLTALNSLLSQPFYRFPNGEVVARHGDFVCIATANTFGTGADVLYVGRTQIDAATLDRFVFLKWGYDETHEGTLAMGIAANRPTMTQAIKAWHARVVAIRATVESVRVRQVISPRATLFGAQMLLAGIPQSDVEDMLIWSRMTADDKSKVQRSMA